MGPILAIAFDAYSTDPKGHILGEIRFDAATGKTYRFIQAGQSLTNSALAANEVVVAKGNTTVEGTNDVSTGTNATYPIVLGRANSACPQSTASVTYYCWVQIGGLGTIKDNGDDDIAAGVALIPDTANDGACDSLPGSATNTADGVAWGIFGFAAADDDNAANTVLAHLAVRVR